MWHNGMPPEAPPNIISQVQVGVHLLAPAAGPVLPPTRLVMPAGRLGLVGPHHPDPVLVPVSVSMMRAHELHGQPPVLTGADSLSQEMVVLQQVLSPVDRQLMLILTKLTQHWGKGDPTKIYATTGVKTHDVRFDVQDRSPNELHCHIVILPIVQTNHQNQLMPISPNLIVIVITLSYFGRQWNLFCSTKFHTGMIQKLREMATAFTMQ